MANFVIHSPGVIIFFFASVYILFHLLSSFSYNFVFLYFSSTLYFDILSHVHTSPLDLQLPMSQSALSFLPAYTTRLRAQCYVTSLQHRCYVSAVLWVSGTMSAHNLSLRRKYSAHLTRLWTLNAFWFYTSSLFARRERIVRKSAPHVHQ